jgi:hypothetical protein
MHSPDANTNAMKTFNVPIYRATKLGNRRPTNPMPLRIRVKFKDSVYDSPRFSLAYELRKKNGKKTPMYA